MGGFEIRSGAERKPAGVVTGREVGVVCMRRRFGEGSGAGKWESERGGGKGEACGGKGDATGGKGVADGGNGDGVAVCEVGGRRFRDGVKRSATSYIPSFTVDAKERTDRMARDIMVDSAMLGGCEALRRTCSFRGRMDA